ncbi:MAG: BlaI/MecI/CopY family transcriptional regulator [Verrucomicrobiota bacterium]
MRENPHMALTDKELTRRERQVMDALYQLERASAQEVMAVLPDRPQYSAVRSLLAVMEEKGAVKHTRESRRYVYEPTVSPVRARKGALRRVLSTFFGGSPEQLVQNLLDPVDGPLSAAEVARIRQLLENSPAPAAGAGPEKQRRAS